MDKNPTFAPTLSPSLRLGRYQILGELGRGAMGVVYEARDPTLERHVALKTVQLPGPAGGAAEFRARFHAEAKSAGQLSHPNIVTIYDFGEADNTVYIAMELLRGETLRDMLDRQRFSLRRATRYAIQIADGLGAAHALDVIHRDIKPSNIVRLESGILKITDFGIAQLPSSNLTVAGTLMGTPRYMSPELIRGGKADPRSDIFSLGVVLYEMLTNEVPFDGPSLSAVMYKIVHDKALDPRDVNENVTPALVAVLSRCLAKEPAQRFATTAELARHLRIASEEDATPLEILPTFLPRQQKTTQDTTARRGLSRLFGRADRTIPLAVLHIQAKATSPGGAVDAGPRAHRLWTVLPLGIGVAVVVVLFALARLHTGGSSAASAAVPALDLPAAATPVVVPPAAQTAASVAVPDTTLIPSLNLGLDPGQLASTTPAPNTPHKAKRKNVEPAAPAPIASVAPEPVAAPPAAAAPVETPAPAPAPPKTPSLEEQLKKQRDCLVANRCE